MINLYTKPVPPEDIKLLCEEYPNYIKLVVDIENKSLCAGGEYHIDCEEVLINAGSKQSDLWGGGLNLETGQIEYQAMTNYKPAYNRLTYEISDPEIRKGFEKCVRYFFKL